MPIRMSIGFDGDGLAEKLRKQYPLEFGRVMNRRLRTVGRLIVSDLKIAAPTGATGNLRQGHDSEVSGTRLAVFNRVGYSVFRSSGTGPQASPPRPGKFPWDRSLPDDQNPPLKRWVRTKGIAQRIQAETNALRGARAAQSGRREFKRMTLEEAADSAAFLVARKIKEQGSPRDPWFTRTVSNSRSMVFQQLRSAAREWLSNMGSS